MNSNANHVLETQSKQENLEQVLKLMDHFSKCDVTHLDIELDGIKLKLKKEKEVLVSAPMPVAQQVVAPVMAPVVESTPVAPITAAPTTSGHKVKAPLVGTYYSSNTPGGKAFVSVGDTVKKGQVLCIIEAMKVMNEIEAPCDGVVKDILVENDAAVGFDEVLMVIE